MNTSRDLYDVFFSYNWRDQKAVEAVAQALKDQGFKVFLDRWYLVPGQPWPRALEQALGSCRAVAIFLGPQALGPWQLREKDLALDRQVHNPQFQVIPVLLPGAEAALGFLSLNTWVDLRDSLDDAGGMEILRAALQGKPPSADLQEKLQSMLAAVCPYRGLCYFREEDAAFFFGRNQYIDFLHEKVASLHLLAVVGASGAGKSSVVRAGLIPQLRQSRTPPVWEALTMVPGERPLRSLAAALLPLLEPELTEVDRLAAANKLAAYLAGHEGKLSEVVTRVLEKQPGTDHLLLVVDQWEELYTLVQEESERRQFINEILKSTERGPITTVLTLRGDFFGQALSYRPLADRLQDAVENLGPMNLEELEQAVKRPAEKVNLNFEPGLMERILNDVGGEPGNLPLLEFALAGLWEQRQRGYLLHEAYEAMGGVEGAIARRADEQFLRLSPLEQQTVSRVFLDLVRPGADCENTRQRAKLKDIGETAWPLVQQLADARLLVTGRDAASGAETVEVAHEALIQHWQRLRGWLDSDREFLLWRQRLRADLEEWQHTDQDPGVLLRGKPLAEARHWLEKRPESLNASERQFIQASISFQEKQEEEERQRQRRELEQAQALAEEQRQRAETEKKAKIRSRFFSGVALGLGFLAVLAALLAYQQTRKASEQYQVATQKTQEAEQERNTAWARTQDMSDMLEKSNKQYRRRIDYQLEVLRNEIEKDVHSDRKSVIEILGTVALGPLHQGRELLSDFLDKDAKIRILLLDPTSPAFKNRQLKENDSLGRLSAESQTSLYTLSDIKKRVGDKFVNLELRFHNKEPDRSLVMINANTERGIIMVTPYPESIGTSGYAGGMEQLYKRNKEDAKGYRANLDYFKGLWEEATMIELNFEPYKPSKWPYNEKDFSY